MTRLRLAVGVATLILLIAGLNLMILHGTLFNVNVLMPLLGGLGLGVLWLVLRAFSLLGSPNKDSRGAFNSVLSSVVFLGIIMTVYAFVEREDLAWDLTQEGRRDLAPQTINILESLTNPVEITCFFIRAGDDRVRIAQDKTARFLRRCQEYTDMLSVEFVDPQKNPERGEALNVLRVSRVGTVVLRSGARQREIPLSDVNARLEERSFTNAVLNVSRDAIPKVYFLTGHGERDITSDDPTTGAAQFRLWLQKEAHEVQRCIIPTDNPLLPDDCSVLIINGYQADLLPHEIQALDRYMDDGGRLLVLVNVQIVQENEFAILEQLRPWLRNRFGIKIGSDIVVSNATQSLEIMFIPDFEVVGATTGTAPQNNQFRGSFNKFHAITRDLDKQLVLSVIRTVSLDPNLPEGVTGTVLMRSTPDTWAETDVRAIDDREPISQDPAEISGPNPVMVAVSARSNRPVGDGDRMRDSRVVVLGDADLALNEYMKRVSNQDLLLNSVAWLTENEELIAIRPTGNVDQPLILSQNEQRLIAWSASLGAVQAIAFTGLLVFLQRRKYR
ncbi:MAG: GldG family protein [Candidatus Hydrogenedentes bacterium]|nr:GldG family protein [Candidatus Hydrogenedentota bacterium]